MPFVLPLKTEREDRCRAGGTLAVVPVDVSSLASRVHTRPSQELARGVPVSRCSGRDIGKDGAYRGDQSVKAFSPCIRGVHV